MALPTAQLGQLPQLNGPSYVPTVVVDKQPKAWEKALLGILSNVATGVVAKGIDNSMSQDYADPSLGEQPTTGFAKFWQGPKVDERQQLQRQTEKGAESRLNRELGSRKDLQATDIAASDKRTKAQQEFELNMQKAGFSHQDATEASRRAFESEQGTKARSEENQNRLQQLATGQAYDQSAEQRREAFQRPLQEAQTARLSGETEAQRIQMELMKRALNPGQVDPKTGKPIVPDVPLTPMQQLVQQNAANPNYRSPFSRTAQAAPQPTQQATSQSAQLPTKSPSASTFTGSDIIMRLEQALGVPASQFSRDPRDQRNYLLSQIDSAKQLASFQNPAYAQKVMADLLAQLNGLPTQ